jgi:enamidase
MRVYAGSVILEPGLAEDDLRALKAAGIWLAKAGFGAFETPFDYAPLMRAARALGMVTTMHTGGSSIPGSSGIWAEHVLASAPTVSFHVNGGPVAMPEAGFARLVNEGDAALQICTAGNLRTALLTARLLEEAGQPERLLIATDTPTGSGIMPLGMLYTISHLASLGGLSPERAIAAATGNNARVYGLNAGFLQVGKDADVVLIDACAGGSQNDALSALKNGDVPAVAAVITDGVPRFVGRSRNTPAAIKTVTVASCRLPRDFSGGG